MQHAIVILEHSEGAALWHASNHSRILLAGSFVDLLHGRKF
jgi:hypothetical protein